VAKGVTMAQEKRDIQTKGQKEVLDRNQAKPDARQNATKNAKPADEEIKKHGDKLKR
jgi:hypothetical protein